MIRTTEIKLTLNPAQAEQTHYAMGGYFQEFPDRVCAHGVQLCAKGLHRYVRLPEDTTEITLVFFKRRVAESFEIGRRKVKARDPIINVGQAGQRFGNALTSSEIRCYALLDHPDVQLLQCFRHELYRYYINGYKFFRIEY